MGLGKVAILGTGTIKFGENSHLSLSDMILEAVNLIGMQPTAFGRG